MAVSVFSGGFASDAVDAVAGPELDAGTLAPLRALADKSLLQIRPRRRPYRMLETLRQYADALLDDAARRRLRDRHLQFLVGLTERIEPTLRGRDGAPGWRRLDAERLDVRAAFAHALATGQGEAALRIAAAVNWWWYRRGQVAEGRRWLADALEAAPGAPAAVRVRALLGDALLAYLAGDVVAIRQRVDEVVAEAPEEAGATLALALVLRAFVRAVLGETDAVAEFEVDAERAVAAAQRSGVAWVRAEIAMTRGQFARIAGDGEAALQHLDEAEAIAVEIGHSWAVGSVLFVRAKVLLALDRVPEAVRTAAMGVSTALADDDAPGVLAILLTGAGAATAAGSPRSGAVILGAVETLSRRVGYDPMQMDPRGRAGLRRRDPGRPAAGPVRRRPRRRFRAGPARRGRRAHRPGQHRPCRAAGRRRGGRRLRPGSAAGADVLTRCRRSAGPAPAAAAWPPPRGSAW